MEKKYLLTTAVLLASGQLMAQKPYNPDIAKSRLNSDAGYRLRTKDERYEGLYTLQVGAPVLEVVSVTHGPIKYELSPTEKLVIEVPALKIYKAVGVSGVSFGLSKNYHLDAIINAGSKKTVPVREVLSPNDIYEQNLGVFGYIGEPQGPALYVPVRASARPRTDAKYEAIRLVLLPGTAIEKFRWSYAKVNQGACSAFQEVKSTRPATTVYPAHLPIVLALPEGNATTAGDELCLDIQFKIVGDDEWRSKSIKLLITQ